MNVSRTVISRRAFLRLAATGALAAACGAPAPAPPIALSRDRPTLVYFFTDP